MLTSTVFLLLTLHGAALVVDPVRISQIDLGTLLLESSPCPPAHRVIQPLATRITVPPRYALIIQSDLNSLQDLNARPPALLVPSALHAPFPRHCLRPPTLFASPPHCLCPPPVSAPPLGSQSLEGLILSRVNGPATYLAVSFGDQKSLIAPQEHAGRNSATFDPSSPCNACEGSHVGRMRQARLAA